MKLNEQALKSEGKVQELNLKVLFDSGLTRKEVKPTPRSIVVMATGPSRIIHSLWRNTYAD